MTGAGRRAPGERTDLAIVGGGAAGLLLAMAVLRRRPATDLIVIDARPSYTADRLWGYFGPDPRLDAWAAQRWSHWTLSKADGDPVIHRGGRSHYAAIRSETVYRAADQAIETAPNARLWQGATVQALTPRPEGVAIVGSHPPVLAAGVLDARPPRPAALAAAPFQQCFLGREVMTESAVFDPATAGLMEQMAADRQGIGFVYVLPFSPTRALIEVTRFDLEPRAPASLSDWLDRAIEERVGPGGHKVVREEGAILPMGLPPEPRLAGDPRILRAGMAAGALRAASGYGFQRLAAWAEAEADALCREAEWAGIAPGMGRLDRTLLPRMDAVFLAAAAKQPTRLADWFLAMARRMGPEGFARFMRGDPGGVDLLRLIASFPPGPFLRAALSGR